MEGGSEQDKHNQELAQEFKSAANVSPDVWKQTPVQEKKGFFSKIKGMFSKDKGPDYSQQTTEQQVDAMKHATNRLDGAQNLRMNSTNIEEQTNKYVSQGMSQDAAEMRTVQEATKVNTDAYPVSAEKSQVTSEYQTQFATPPQTEQQILNPNAPIDQGGSVESKKVDIPVDTSEYTDEITIPITKNKQQTPQAA